MKISPLGIAKKILDVYLDGFDPEKDPFYRIEHKMIDLIKSILVETERNDFIGYLYDELLRMHFRDYTIWFFTEQLLLRSDLIINKELVRLLDKKLDHIEDDARMFPDSATLRQSDLFCSLTRTLKYYRRSSPIIFSSISPQDYKTYKYLTVIKFISCEEIRDFGLFINLGVFENLKQLVIYNTSISENDLNIFCESPLLKQLEILSIGNRENLFFPKELLNKLMRRQDLIQLKKIAFNQLSLSSVESIVFSPIMKNLESLSLTKGMVSDWDGELEFLLKHLNYDILSELIIWGNDIREDILLEFRRKYLIPEKVKIFIHRV